MYKRYNRNVKKLLFFLIPIGLAAFFLFRPTNIVNESVGEQYPMVKNEAYLIKPEPPLIPPGEPIPKNVVQLINQGEDGKFYCQEQVGTEYLYRVYKSSLFQKAAETISGVIGSVWEYEEKVIDCGDEYFVYILRHGQEFYGPFKK